MEDIMSGNVSFKALLIAAIAIAGLSFCVLDDTMPSDADTGTCGSGVTYSLIGNVLTIESNGMGTGEMYDYGAGTAPWYNVRESISTLDLHEGIVSIGSYAFYGCSNICMISQMPESIESIGDHAFSGCEMIFGDMCISKNVSYIGDCAFSAAGFTSITVDAENEHYMSENGILFNKDQTELIQATSGNTVEGYTIPSTVTKVCSEAFYYGKGMFGVLTVPASVTSIGERAFSAAAFSAIQVDEANSNYSSDSGVLYSKDGTTLIQVTISNTSIGFKVPSSVRSISECAFLDCMGLTGNLELGDNIRSIGARAFESCSGFTGADIGDVSGISETAFNGWGFYRADGTKMTSMSQIANHNYTGTYERMVVSDSPGTFKVSYNKNGGTGDVPESTIVYPSWTYTVKFTPAPSKSGVEFKGWSESPAAESATYTEGGLDSFEVMKDTVLYATYTALPTCTVSYDANGGTGDVPESSTFTSGTEYTVLFTPAPSKSGYIFAGWSTDKEATSPEYRSAGTVKFTPTSDTTLYAVYSSEQCTVTYDANGGTGSVPDATTISFGSTYSVVFAPHPSKDDSDFKGWSESSAAKYATYTLLGSRSFTVSGDVTLYAVYSESVSQCLVSFDSNGGSSAPPSSYSTDEGSSITLPGYSGVKDGYDFKGWKCNGSTYSAGASVQVNQDMQFVAVWTEKSEFPITLVLAIAIAALIIIVAAIYLVRLKNRYA